MRSAQDFVTPQAQHSEHAEDMSGVRGATEGMAPYPLYGIPALGQDEPTVVFYKRPWFCWTGGIVLGLAGGFVLGQATASIGFALLKLKKNPKRRRRKRKAEENA